MADTNTSEDPSDESDSSNGGRAPPEAMMTTGDLLPNLYANYSTYDETYHETSIFTDFNGPPEVVAEEMKDFSSDGETTLDTESSSDSEEDEGDEVDAANAADHEPIIHNSPELGATVAHLDEAVVSSGGPHNKPTSFTRLLDSPYAPTRGTFDMELSLKEDEAEVEFLKTEKKRVKLLLKQAKDRCQETRQKLEFSNKAFKALREYNGIPAELWREYEAFCESLEPRFGCRGGWSVTCFADHKNSYVNYDPQLSLFMESAEFPLGLHNCNFRCEAYTVDVPSPKARLDPDCPPAGQEYVVEFWPVASPVPRTGIETTWGEQYPELYRLATRALYDLTRTDTQAASELLRSLPDPRAPFSGGWLFEYQPGEKLASHSVLSRRWVYRSAHRISDPSYEFDEEDPITDSDAAEASDSDQEEQTTAESFDVNMLFGFSHQQELEEDMDLN
ncbi:hypothetical protein N0V82_008834 [Gnomoniopsis sp. IMI 355080]|nr:hypothetical protein N0V82_008834 [Gnomoniopsis sp. IMI 355080]